MISARNEHGYLVHAFLFAALLLRVAIPVGSMPAAGDDGWYLSICPDGIPVKVVHAWLGHHHAHHGDSGASFVQCELGSAAGSDAILLDDAPAAVRLSELATSQTLNVYFERSKRWFNHRARAPPYSRVS